MSANIWNSKAASPAQNLLVHYDVIADWHAALYRDLHQHPELSHAEYRTAEIVAARLRDLGYQVVDHIGGTGVVGVIENQNDEETSGSRPVVLARADMDGLPVTEATGLPYASTDTALDADGNAVGVMHACGHDAHMTVLLATAQLLAEHQDEWRGTFIALFQPAEEIAAGAKSMVDDGLVDLIPRPTVALAQHVMPLPCHTVVSRAGAVLSAADSIKVTIFGRGAHGSAPQTGVDPVVIAAAIVMRLQSIVSRELEPGHFGVVTVGAVRAGWKSNIIPDSAELRINVRAYDQTTRATLQTSIERIVRAECEASGVERSPEFEYYESFDLTENSPDVHARISSAFTGYFGNSFMEMEPWAASEDFEKIPNALGIPYLYWGFGSVDPVTYELAKKAGVLSKAIPGNHSPFFAPVADPTLRTGTAAMVVATMAYLTRRD